MPTEKKHGTSAPAVSRILRSGGFGVVTTYLREGLRISRGPQGTATVYAQFDHPNMASRRATEAGTFLIEQGFVVGQSERLLVVGRPESTAREEGEKENGK